jgi:radical SAM superfamily enzyme YgiQ (UPF0313 family)
VCVPGESDIVIVAINARYSHCAFAARTLMANLGALQKRAEIIEADTDVQPFQLAAAVAARRPQIAGFSVYLWNAARVRETALILRRVSPRTQIVLGGPEIVPGDHARWDGVADARVTGEGESAFRALCAEALAGGTLCGTDGAARRVCGAPADPTDVALPYSLYTADDLARRTVYVESSRGCPCGCVYCTSNRTPFRCFDPARLAEAFDSLIARGVRAFRFLDRSFNADENHACAMLDLFLARHPGRFQIHLEILPQRFGSRLRQTLAAFPPGTLHLEIGVQTLNPAVAHSIGRSSDIERVLDALAFLIREARATVHADLIFGLPGEDEASFAAGFDRLVIELDPPELQVNLLKGLPGTPLAAPGFAPELVFNPNPPYELLRSDVLDFNTVVRMQDFARCWDLVHNRGRFPEAARAIWARDTTSPYACYRALSERILAAEGRLYALGARKIGDHLDAFLQERARGTTPHIPTPRTI